MEGLERNSSWAVVDSQPKGEEAVNSKWAFQWETDEHGYLMKVKTHVVLRVIVEMLVIFQRSHQPLPQQPTDMLQR